MGPWQGDVKEFLRSARRSIDGVGGFAQFTPIKDSCRLTGHLFKATIRTPTNDPGRLKKCLIPIAK
jgi:hypothetical protein